MDDEDELLLRYHFGDVSHEERRDFERRLENDAELRERLDALQECIATHEADPDEAASPDCSGLPLPRKLADRTADAVLTAREESVSSCVGRKRFSLVETAAIGVAAMMIGALILSAMQASRSQARRIACEKGMLDVSQALFQYANDHGSRFPTVMPGENAGMFTVALADAGYANREFLERTLVCPSSELATQIAAGHAAVVVPTRAELHSAPSFLLDRLRRFMAGAYAYRMGHLDGNAYVYPRFRADSRAAILADAPASGCGESVVSMNHGACGQNVLYEDGHVDFQTGCWTPGQVDHLFLNDAGKIAAGRTPQDSVLGRSEATPGVMRVIRIRF